MEYSIIETLESLKSGTVKAEDLLYNVKGRNLHDVDLNNLRISTMPSGFDSLDDYLFLKTNRSELIIVGGRPSMGKSAFMFQVAFNVARQYPVHVFSLEMDHEMIVARMLAGLLNRPVDAILRGLVSRAELKEAHDKIKALDCFIDERAGLNIAQIADAAKLRAKKYGTKLVVIDYLQIISSQKGYSRDAEVAEISKSLKELAKDLKIPIVVGSQLNRQCEARGYATGNYQPLLSDLRESGSIEQDADIVVAVHREHKYTGLRQNEADIIILKNRNGPTGEIAMNFFPAQTLFSDKTNRGDI